MNKILLVSFLVSLFMNVYLLYPKQVLKGPTNFELIRDSVGREHDWVITGKAHTVIIGDWARVTLLDEKIIYYLSQKDNEWSVIASGKSFNIKKWNKYNIPNSIR